MLKKYGTNAQIVCNVYKKIDFISCNKPLAIFYCS